MPSSTTAANGDEQFASLEQELYYALMKEGLFVPETDEDVTRAEEELSASDIVLPESLSDPDSILAKRESDIRVDHMRLRDVSNTAENLARAARAGGVLPLEIEERMRRDRAQAERKAREGEQT